MARKILRPAKKPNFLIRDRDLLQQKREAVAEAAFALFLKEGFHRTTTRDIARRAGVSAGAPFTYFKDTGADPEEVFETVFTTFLRSVDAMRRFILLAYQETKSLNTETRQASIAREKRLQALLGEAIRYGAKRGRFAPDNIELKAHNIMVLGHAWATRHWAFAGEMKSIEEYIAFLQPLMLAMLETNPVIDMAKKERRQPTALEGRVMEGQGEVTAK